jgi:hypothetical protein
LAAKEKYSMSKKLGHLIVSGRWDNWVAIVDVEKALLPENNATDRAIISRPRVTPDVDTNGDGIPDMAQLKSWPSRSSQKQLALNSTRLISIAVAKR